MTIYRALSLSALLTALPCLAVEDLSGCGVGVRGGAHVPFATFDYVPISATSDTITYRVGDISLIPNASWSQYNDADTFKVYNARFGSLYEAPWPTPFKRGDRTTPYNHAGGCDEFKRDMMAAGSGFVGKVFTVALRTSLNAGVGSYGFRYDDNAIWQNDPRPMPGPPPSRSCTMSDVRGDVSSGPITTTLSVTCASWGGGRVELLNSDGIPADKGVLTDGRGSVTVLPRTGPWPTDFVYDGDKPTLIPLEIKPAPDNLPGDHVFTGTLRTTTP